MCIWAKVRDTHRVFPSRVTPAVSHRLLHSRALSRFIAWIFFQRGRHYHGVRFCWCVVAIYCHLTTSNPTVFYSLCNSSAHITRGHARLPPRQNQNSRIIWREDCGVQATIITALGSSPQRRSHGPHSREDAHLINMICKRLCSTMNEVVVISRANQC